MQRQGELTQDTSHLNFPVILRADGNAIFDQTSAQVQQYQQKAVDRFTSNLGAGFGVVVAAGCSAGGAAGVVLGGGGRAGGFFASACVF